MIEFVGLPPILENHIRGCHGNHGFSHSVDLVSQSDGSTEQFGMNLKGPMSVG